jgi:hypothetical protein
VIIFAPGSKADAFGARVFMRLFSKADASEALHQPAPPPHPTADHAPMIQRGNIGGWVGRVGGVRPKDAKQLFEQAHKPAGWWSRKSAPADFVTGIK